MEKVKIETLKGLEKLPDNVTVKQYVSIKDKYVYANGLVDMIIKYDKDDMSYEDPIASRVIKAVGMVALYTNIELLEDSYECYDILKENDLLHSIEEMIGTDCAEFYEIIFDLVWEKIDRYNSFNYIVSRKTDDMLAIFNRTMKHVDGMLDKGDPNKIAKYLSKGIEVIANKLPDLSKLDVFEPINGKKMN